MNNDTTSNSADPQYQFGFIETLAGGSGEKSPWFNPSGFFPGENDIPFPESENDYGADYSGDEADTFFSGEMESCEGLSIEDKAGYIFAILTDKQNEFEGLIGTDKMLSLTEYFFLNFLDIDLNTLGEEYDEVD